MPNIPGLILMFAKLVVVFLYGSKVKSEWKRLVTILLFLPYSHQEHSDSFISEFPEWIAIFFWVFRFRQIFNTNSKRNSLTIRTHAIPRMWMHKTIEFVMPNSTCDNASFSVKCEEINISVPAIATFGSTKIPGSLYANAYKINADQAHDQNFTTLVFKFRTCWR